MHLFSSDYSLKKAALKNVFFKSNMFASKTLQSGQYFPRFPFQYHMQMKTYSEKKKQLKKI